MVLPNLLSDCRKLDAQGCAFLVLVCPSKGLQKGQVVNISGARESVRASIRAAKKRWFQDDSLLFCMSGKHVSSGNKRGVISITATEKTVEKKM